MILYLPPSLSLARLANSSAAAPISEPGSPTCPNFSSVCAWAPSENSAASAAMPRCSLIMVLLLVVGLRRGAGWFSPALGQIGHRRLHTFTFHRHARELQAHLHARE